MKEGIFLMNLLFFSFCVEVRSSVFVEIHEAKRDCTFILSDGEFEEFFTAVPLFANCTKQFTKANLLIKLINYTLPAFPTGTFTNLPPLKSFTLKICNRSQIQLLSPHLPEYIVFENLTFENALIDVSDSPNLNGWKWKILWNMSYNPIRRFTFSVVKSKLIRLDPSFGKIAGGHLTAIRIIQCQLRWLGENVFQPLHNLISLELRKNFLEKFERSHLPKDASKLQYLDLGQNKLKYLSQDLFNDLRLKSLFLDGNNFQLLEHQVNSIMETDTLTQISGVAWPCECKMLKQLAMRITMNLSENCYTNDSNINIKLFLAFCEF